MKRSAFLLLPLLLSPLAHAHPGEHPGQMLAAIEHLLTEPDHLALAAIAIVVGIAGARLHRRRNQARVRDTRV